MNNNSFIILIIFTILIFSCKKAEEIKVETSQTSKKETEYYFPIQTDSLDERPYVMQEGKLIPTANEWFSSHLKSMNEPILYNLEDSVYIIRYTNLGTWFAPITYRIQKMNSGITITYKETNGQGGFEPGKLMVDSSAFLSFYKFNDIDKALNKYDFWKQKTFNEWGLDGSMLILEVYKYGKYKFITRWSPRRENEAEFMDICQMIEDIYKQNK